MIRAAWLRPWHRWVSRLVARLNLFRQIGCVLLLGANALAADLAVLRNGFSIRHEKREVVGPNTRLHIGAGNWMDVPTDQIASIEPDTSLPPQAPPPAARPVERPPRPEVAGNPKPSAFDLEATVRSASQKHLIDPDLIHSIIRRESGGKSTAVSRKGAQGLMQIMPGTAAQLGLKDAFDGGANVEAGTRYFNELLTRYNGDMVRALAAYNAGPKRVDHYRGVPPYRETRSYVASIVRDFNRKKLAARKAAKEHKPRSEPRQKSARVPANEGSVQSAGIQQASDLALE